MTTPFGSLGETLARTNEGARFLESAGPVSDAFIVGVDSMALLNGPIGSAKTFSLGKKAIMETTRLFPWDNGLRHYCVSVVRDKYTNLWGSTINSWHKVFPVEAFPDWSGSSGRPAEHKIRWRDDWGDCLLHAKFRAFGESSDEEDTRGWECGDLLLDEWDTTPEKYMINLSGRVGREPTIQQMRRAGRMYGAANAPDVLNYIYRDFFEDVKPGFKLYRQPGGMDPGAENPALGRAYYESIIEKNAHRAWYIKRMVHNKPGFTRDSDVVYPMYDDDRHRSPEPIAFDPHLPVIVGVDGGNTPAAVYLQATPRGQLRILREVATTVAGMKELSRAMLELEARDFRGATFRTECDPAMRNGEDTEEGSDRARLAKYLKRPVHLATTNNPERRHEPLAEYMRRNCDDGSPGLWLDPSLKILRRGFSQTFGYHRVRGSNERSRVVKNPDSHTCEACEYGAMATGRALDIRNDEARKRERRERSEQARKAGRYDPLARARA